MNSEEYAGVDKWEGIGGNENALILDISRTRLLLLVRNNFSKKYGRNLICLSKKCATVPTFRRGGDDRHIHQTQRAFRTFLWTQISRISEIFVEVTFD